MSCLGICCSHYFKQLDNVQEIMINLSLHCCVTVELVRVQYINLSEIAHVVKAVLTVNDALLNLSMLFVYSHFFKC